MKPIYGLQTSPKKQTVEFVFFAFLLFKANKTNSSAHCLRESMARQSGVWFYLTFSLEFWWAVYSSSTSFFLDRAHAEIAILVVISGNSDDKGTTMKDRPYIMTSQLHRFQCFFVAGC